MSKTFLFQAIQFSQTVLIQTIQFSSNQSIGRALSGVITPGQSGPGSNCNEGVLHISQSSNITGASQSDRLGSYLGQSLCVWGGYPSAEVQSVYSTAPAEWAV